LRMLAVRDLEKETDIGVLCFVEPLRVGQLESSQMAARREQEGHGEGPQTIRWI